MRTFFLWLQTTIFSFCPQMTFLYAGEDEWGAAKRKREISGVFASSKDTDPIRLGVHPYDLI